MKALCKVQRCIVQVKQKCFVIIPVIFCGYPINYNAVITKDPCEIAKNAQETATFLSRDSSFNVATNAIRQASKDRHEHSITFGKSATGVI